MVYFENNICHDCPYSFSIPKAQIVLVRACQPFIYFTLFICCLFLHQREVVEQLLQDSNINHAIISDNLRKVYPGTDGNPDKLAVQGLSLAVPNGECFGMLGPNGAGKSTFINMVCGNFTSVSTFLSLMNMLCYIACNLLGLSSSP